MHFSARRTSVISYTAHVKARLDFFADAHVIYIFPYLKGNQCYVISQTSCRYTQQNLLSRTWTPFRLVHRYLKAISRILVIHVYWPPHLPFSLTFGSYRIQPMSPLRCVFHHRSVPRFSFDMRLISQWAVRDAKVMSSVTRLHVPAG